MDGEKPGGVMDVAKTVGGVTLLGGGCLVCTVIGIFPFALCVWVLMWSDWHWGLKVVAALVLVPVIPYLVGYVLRIVAAIVGR